MFFYIPVDHEDRDDSRMELEEDEEDEEAEEGEEDEEDEEADFDAAETMASLIRWLSLLRAHQRRNVNSMANGNFTIF